MRVVSASRFDLSEEDRMFWARLLSVIVCAMLWVNSAGAEIIWINDWDSPRETKGWASAVSVMDRKQSGFVAYRDLDGDGRYGTPQLKSGRPVWGVETIEAPAGQAFTKIMVVWARVAHHKPCNAGYQLSVSHTGKFAGEELVVRTPNTTGQSSLKLDLSGEARYRRVSRIFIRLEGWQYCGWGLGCSGVVATAEIVDARTGNKMSPPGRLVELPAQRLAFQEFLFDAGDRCVVDVQRGLSVNGYSRIENEIFSLTAYEGAPDFDTKAGTKGADFCREYGIEGIGFPANMGWVVEGPWWKEWTHQQIDEWFDSGKALEMFTNYGAWTSRYVYGRILPNLRRVGSRPFLYLYGPEPPSKGCGNGACQEKWIHMSNRYLAMCLKIDPRLEWVHLFGEANARWFRSGATARDYTGFFNKWAAETKKRFPRLKLGGPVTWGKPTRGPSWDGWCLQLMEDSHDHLDFLDWHSYNPSPGQLAGDIHAVSGFMLQRHGKQIRNALTETNYGVGSRGDWHEPVLHYRRRAIPMMRQTFELLRHPDKIFSRQFHDYAAWAGSYDARFLGNEKLPVTPMMQLYKIFKPLRGHRVLTGNPFHNVLLEAAVREKTLAVAIANTGQTSRKVPLSLVGLPTDGAPGTAKILTATGLADFALPREGLPESLSLPPESLLVATWAMKQPVVFKDSVRRWEFYADSFMQQVARTGDWEVSTEVVLNAKVRRAATAARLRLGIVHGGDKASSRWLVQVGGRVYEVDRAHPFLDLRLPEVPDSDVVPVRVTALDAPEVVYAISFVSLVLESNTDYKPTALRSAPIARRSVWVNDFGTETDRKAWSSFTRDDATADRDGDGRGGRVVLSKSGHTIWGVEKIEAVGGEAFNDLLVTWDVYRVTPNGGDWMVELSPNGRFAGEQIQQNTPRGVGRVSLRLETGHDERFRDLKSVFIRLSGANGVLDWSASAGAVTLSARTR